MVAPVATPIAPPTVAPIARPMPGCSASIAGTVASNLASEVPGARMLMCFSGTPSERRIATARFASVNELNTPTTVVMLQTSPHDSDVYALAIAAARHSKEQPDKGKTTYPQSYREHGLIH